MSRVWLKANVCHRSSGFWKNSVIMKQTLQIVHLAALFYVVHECESGALVAVTLTGCNRTAWTNTVSKSHFVHHKSQNKMSCTKARSVI